MRNKRARCFLGRFTLCTFSSKLTQCVTSVPPLLLWPLRVLVSTQDDSNGPAASLLCAAGCGPVGNERSDSASKALELRAR